MTARKLALDTASYMAMENLPQLVQSLKGAAVKPRAQPSFGLEDCFIGYALNNAAVVATTDLNGTITYANDKFCQISGYSKEELIGSNHRIIKSGIHDATFFDAMYRQIASGHVWHGEICNRRKDGSIIWVDTTIVPHLSNSGQVDGYASIRFDITTRKQFETALQASYDHLFQLASIDSLTELPNRRSFQEHVMALVATQGTRRFCLALLDLDGFKTINDSFGHLAGNKVLTIVASRLRKIGDERFFAARLGGDEFGMVFTDASEADAVEFFDQILEGIREPIQIKRIQRHCSASVGLAFFPHDGVTMESLLRSADLALYHAKALGRDRGEVFRLQLKEEADRRAELLAEIENGLRLEAFELHYQPIVPIASDQDVSLEALMRWRHPERGLLTPESFLGGLLDPGIRAEFGMFMLEKVFRDAASLRENNTKIRRIAMNLTDSDFRSESFIDRFLTLSEATGIGPEWFCAEITEGTFLGAGQKRVRDGLERLHHAGVEIALDDFGTGHGSLTHLRELPIDRLKIDRSFIANIISSREDRTIVHGMIEMAHGLGKTVTAEGVETLEQARLLIRMNCDQLQGWYFSKACEVERLPECLKQITRF